jgi:hypothetical protein
MLFAMEQWKQPRQRRSRPAASRDEKAVAQNRSHSTRTVQTKKRSAKKQLTVCFYWRARQDSNL